MRKVFYYKNVNFSEESGVLFCSYAVDDSYTFTEKIYFPDAPFKLSPRKKRALSQIFKLLHIAVGISYYKAFLPEQIVVEGEGLTPDEASFFNRFYLEGLGEFAVRNQINLQGKIHFPFNPHLKRECVDLKLPYNALIPVGGGKDSCVTIELIKGTDLPAATISMNKPRPILECMDRAKLPQIMLQRELDPQLLILNQKTASTLPTQIDLEKIENDLKGDRIYNGHVPITGILAFILWVSAILYDKKYVIMSCERSANVGNMKQGNLSINHQYSKSFAFEKDFYQITQSITPEFRYFSLLRPLSEAHIAKLFSQKCQRYFPVFTSCNKAFKLDQKKRLDRWCGDCDKCRFVFLILAPFMPKEDLIKIVGTNLLNDEKQLLGYEELLGLSGHKPFECVGEVSESRWALFELSKKDEWKQDLVIQKLKGRLLDVQEGDIFIPSPLHLIPEELKDVLVEFRK